jgi:hypothetical protein
MESIRLRAYNRCVIRVNINQVKAHLSEYVERLEKGETIIL